GYDCRPEHAACDALQDFCQGDQCEARPKSKNEDTQRNGHHTGGDQQSFPPDHIHEFAAWHLTSQTGDAAYSEDEPNIFRGPALDYQVGGRNGPESGLHAGQKKVEPAQGKQTRLRWCGGFPHGHRFSDTLTWHPWSGYTDTCSGAAAVSFRAAAPMRIS